MPTENQVEQILEVVEVAVGTIKVAPAAPADLESLS
jgi:hypothetical protein